MAGRLGRFITAPGRKPESDEKALAAVQKLRDDLENGMYSNGGSNYEIEMLESAADNIIVHNLDTTRVQVHVIITHSEDAGVTNQVTVHAVDGPLIVDSNTIDLSNLAYIPTSIIGQPAESQIWETYVFVVSRI